MLIEARYLSLGFGQKVPKIVKAEQKITFVLGKVKRKGIVQAIGFGIDYRTGGVGELFQKRNAQVSALRNLSYFIAGMAFKIKVSKNKLLFTETKFRINYKIREVKKFAFKKINKFCTLCRTMSNTNKVDAVVRRNCKMREGQSSAVFKSPKEIPKAFENAKNKLDTRFDKKSCF